MKNQPLPYRLSFATAGIAAAWKRERTFRTQVFLGAGAVAVTLLLRPGLMWGAAVALSVVLVLALELVNSALEALIDRLHPEPAPEIGMVKDMAAGAVLLASIGSVVVGVLMIADTLLR